MPWLKKESEKEEDRVLFIHIPRCGGTSITKHHKVSAKAKKGKNIYYRAGITFYYYRYKLLESTNFPVLTVENLIALIQFTIACILFVFLPPGIPAPYIMWTTSTTLFLNSTFVWTAPIFMRVDWMRTAFMYLQDPLLCGVGSDINYLVGTNRKGYLFHLTAERCLRYGYVEQADMKRNSFSIIRNPYSRMVSMYYYNKRLFESFDHFVKAFHKKGMKTYHGKGKTDSNYIYCHIVPMNAYTHLNGKQIVNTIIKQEHLKRLASTQWKDSGVPKKISQALTGIPHANSRKKKMPWPQFYTQETMDLVLEMYEKDFDIFGYDKTIPNRPELVPKVTTKGNIQADSTLATGVGTLLRRSTKINLGDVEEVPASTNSSPKPPEAPSSPVLASARTNRSPMVETPEKAASARFSKKMLKTSVSSGNPRYSKDKTTSSGELTFEGDIIAPESNGKGRVTSRSIFKQGSLKGEELVKKKRAASAFVLHLD